MREKSRRELTIEGLVAASVLFAAIGVCVFAEDQKMLWLQATATVTIIAAGIFGLRVAWQQKKCKEPMTVILKHLCKRVAIAWALVITAVLFILAMRANTPQAWFIFVMISGGALAGAFWERRSPQT